MARIANPFTVFQRSDRAGKWYFNLNPECGLPKDVCLKYHPAAFSTLPDDIAIYRVPKSEAAARRGVQAFIDYLKDRIEQNELDETAGETVCAWVELFTSAETSPRASRLIAKNRAYSPATISNYASLFDAHLKDDPFMRLRMGRVSQADVLAFLRRLSTHKKKEKSAITSPDKKAPTIAGTRQYESVFSFVRMTFREYQMTHPGWVDPFLSIERPPQYSAKRGSLEEDEVLLLFTTEGVFSNTMEKAVAAAAFWAGLRRSEIFALKPEHLDWNAPKIRVCQAWKNFNRKTRELGDPKHHKVRDTLFPDILQDAIKALWDENGKHEFVFSFKDGSTPTQDWWRETVPGWFKKAGIDVKGRRITPHSSRHSLASILEKQGASLRYIQDILGHSDLKTTKGYLHTPSDMINQLTNRINNKNQE